ncbi:hypothetical protein ACWNT8_06720 [Pigmentibacter ruber]
MKGRFYIDVSEAKNFDAENNTYRLTVELQDSNERRTLTDAEYNTLSPEERQKYNCEDKTSFEEYLKVHNLKKPVEVKKPAESDSEETKIKYQDYLKNHAKY